MTETKIPPMEPLAPIVDEVRDLAAEELPAPKTLRVYLWDDGTYDICAYHNNGEHEQERVVFDPEAGEIRWEYCLSGGLEERGIYGTNQSVLDPIINERRERHLRSIEAPSE